MTLVIQPPSGGKLTLAKEFTPQSYMYEFPSQYPVWTPAEITTALWLDAADASTITESGGAVSQWDDKSGNGKNVTASSTLRPTYTSAGLNSLNVVTYSGAQRLQAATAGDWDFMHDGSEYSVFAVWQAGTSNDPNAAYALCSTRTSGFTLGAYVAYDDRVIPSSSNKVIFQAGTSGGQAYVVNSSNNDVHSPNVATILGIEADIDNATAALRSTIRVNAGAAIQNNTISTAAVAGTPQHALIIGAFDGALFLTGYIAEFVIVNGAVATDTRQKIEGYLAHKWGLTANLPAGHPYKTVGPTP